jgi:hypothetical protein
MRSIVGVLSGLFECLVGGHFVLEGDEDVLDGGGVLPGLELGQALDAAVGLVDGGDVDLVGEGDEGRLLGVLGPAVDGEEVDPVLEVGLRGERCTL